MGNEHANMPLTYRRIVTLAVPIFLGNISVPLVGFTDTAVIGHGGSTADLGAIALGAIAASLILWSFGFLRLATTGLTAQAFGRGDNSEILLVLARALILAAVLGTALALVGPFTADMATRFYTAGAEVEAGLETYLTIRLWSAPAALVNFALLGWFVGRQQMRIALLLTLIINLVNIALDLLFVIGFGWGVDGVAAASLLGEYAAAIVGLLLAVRHRRESGLPMPWREAARLRAMAPLMAVNADIFLRTVALAGSFAFFSNQGARMGDATLAANQVLLQFLTLAAFALDAFANTAEALVGSAVGRKSRDGFRDACRKTTLLAVAAALLISAGYWFGAEALLSLITDLEDVRAAALPYLIWAVILPIAGVWSYQLDGIFIGATRTIAMRNTMLISAGLFIVAAPIATEWGGNHGLWAAMMLFLLLRAATLAATLPGLDRSIETSESK